jgi:amidohydrolase
VVLFQPNEERFGGAKAMIADGLYDPNRHACPPPDVVLGQHVMPAPAGTLGTRRGAFGSVSDCWEVTIYGHGGHSSQPHHTVDPIVMAAHVIVRLQTVVSREIDPRDPTVVTVASIHAGLTENIIADFAVMKINIRTQSAATRAKVITAIKRIVKAECEASGAPLEPKWVATHNSPLTINDNSVTAHLEGPFKAHFGSSYNSDFTPLAGSEDFSTLATEAPNKKGGKGVPYSFWVFGGTDPKKYKDAERKGRVEQDIPINHSAYFAPVIQPTMKTGVEALVVGAMTFLT